MNKDSAAVRFLYGTILGRKILELIMRTRADRLAVRFLRSSWSRPLAGWYAKRHSIPISAQQLESFRSFRDFFARSRGSVQIDPDPSHLISPCDGWLSAHPIHEDSSFLIKQSRYYLHDLLQDENLANSFHGGRCLIFRLCASDYHHYCYIDDGYQGENNYIPGTLHSVQPIACETYPVYVLNRRCWTLLATKNFGPVVQTEIGALIVGGIVNPQENIRIFRGGEMGHFDLAGSTIVLLFQKERIELLPHIIQCLAQGREYRVEQGMWIGKALGWGSSHWKNKDAFF